ncbi:reprolysin-like metallopeptidase [Hymenobacter rigui]|uniref:T9SS C-terminal target domain-containing protein n=1 Tax=Hymenobacter rigui TaxID=334424 RepID=A0A428KQU8_9BACT|nr:zinc-dependent metalloprotease family protein [Hymenobacter rigui]RSK48872.1 T9SS C-terminal target domain-containing protein [Hymenobacter rigui]
MIARLLLTGGLGWLSVAIAAAQHPAAHTNPVAWHPVSAAHRQVGGLTIAVEASALEATLRTAPPETQAAAGILLPVPLPDGSVENFRVWRVPVMAPELAARYPAIQTYAGQSLQNPAVSARFDLTPQGFHGLLLGSPVGKVVIEPVDAAAGLYASRTASSSASWSCTLPASTAKQPTVANRGQAAAFGSTLLTYRLALACTGEYATAVTANATPAVATTKLNVLAAMVTAINRVTGIYEKELAIRLVLIGNNDQLIYLSAATDPYTNDDGSAMLGENQANVDAVIGTARYDIGHVFSTGGGGIAALQAVCDVNIKAQGVTGLPNPRGDGFYVDYVAHEMGHQFGGNHTFNSVTGSCNGNRNRQTAMEPGSGTTIMAYAGICGADNVQSNSDPYFHAISQDEIRSYVLDTRTNYGGACPVYTSTGNQAPVVTAGASYTIPQGTPFTLTGSATDANGDALTYAWEQMDQSSQGGAPAAAATSTTAPLFRAFAPVSTGTRTFPRLTDILSNTATIGETLPTVARTMNFRLTARDNRPGGGGVGSASTAVNTTAAGPFLITTANSAITQAPLSTFTVTWSVNNTTSAPINAANVRILFSTDGGQTFPYVLAANTPNDGSQGVVFPNVRTSTGRLRVEAVGNIFFDINNADITLSGPLPVTLTRFTAAAEGTTALLHWTTAQEVHNAGFEVQLQGPDDQEFRKVAFVAGQGSTTQSQSYALRVPDLGAGRWYVRLHQLDEGGQTGSFSSVQSVLIRVPAVAASIWPNPLPAGQGTITVELPTAGTAQVTLYDVLGRPVATQPPLALAAGKTDVPLTLPAVPAGLYMWQLTVDGRPATQGRVLLRP